MGLSAGSLIDSAHVQIIVESKYLVYYMLNILNVSTIFPEIFPLFSELIKYEKICSSITGLDIHLCLNKLPFLNKIN